MGKTRGVHETTPELRNRMVGMYEAGLGLREIAAAVNCSQRTVKRWLNRFDKEGTVETRERCGRKRATTVEQDEAIIKLATQTPITAAKAVLPALGLSCSVDTIRERLHKAGIHNWSPSKKHIQRIPLGDADGAAIQQAVWRPTGTQLGKKKAQKPEEKSKKTGAVTKKKLPSKKLKSKEIFIEDSPPIDSSKSQELNELPEYSFNPQNLPQAPQVAELPPPPQPLLTNQPEFGNSMSLVLPPHQMYTQDTSAMTVNQSWPLVLGQSVHHFTPTNVDPLAHDEPPPPRHLQELHTQREQEQQVTEQQNRQSIHSRHLELVNLEETNLNRSRVQSTSSNSYSNDNSSDPDNEQSTDGDKDDQAPQKTKRKTKKGGKAKGTLETSVEIRNRMIGMAEAGLTTLSIALAINRSERTVKRWLERWNKEGNVQTKERKGRRRITTKEQDEAIIAMATQHPLTAAKHVAPALGLNCSVDTIRERLHKAGIHSWKLGKKQGEGNAVPTVHLWQPSGNRPNKPKAPADKRKKSPAAQKSSEPVKRTMRKKKNEAPAKNMAPQESLIAEQSALQYHDVASYQPPVPTMLQPVHVPATQLISGSGIAPPGPQPMQSIGPMMQPRPDCRLATSIPGPSNNPLAYSSCMVSSGHMEQNDPLNYEPFIWTF